MLFANGSLANPLLFSGVYILNILWGSKQVSGCPLKLHVTPSCDASLVEAAGAGLKECVVNKPCAIKIDTSKAGPSMWFLPFFDCFEFFNFLDCKPGELTWALLLRSRSISRTLCRTEEGSHVQSGR